MLLGVNTHNNFVKHSRVEFNKRNFDELADIEFINSVEELFYNNENDKLVDSKHNDEFI